MIKYIRDLPGIKGYKKHVSALNAEFVTTYKEWEAGADGKQPQSDYDAGDEKDKEKLLNDEDKEDGGDKGDGDAGDDKDKEAAEDGKDKGDGNADDDKDRETPQDGEDEDDTTKGGLFSKISSRLEYISELYEYRIFEHAENEDKEFVKFEIDSMMQYLRTNFPLLSMLSQSPEALEKTLNNAKKKELLKRKIVEASTMEKAMAEYSLESLKDLDKFLASKVKGMVETLEKRHLDKISNVEVSVDRFGEIENNNNVLPETEMQRKFSPSNSTFPNRVEIDRIHWKNLSLKTFFYKYAKKKGQLLSKDCRFQKRRGRYDILSQNVETTP